MPRRKLGATAPRRGGGGLVDRLVVELRSAHESGQPLIYEEEFPTGKRRLSVLWDAWDRSPPEDRTEIILRAYVEALGPDFRSSIALASGLTFPEAYAAGMLPFEVYPARRRDDLVTLEQCKTAMIMEGASTLIDPDRPQLRFATLGEAEDAQRRLGARLPNSEAIWTTIQEIGRIEDHLPG